MKTMLVDLIQNFINTLLGKIRCFGVWFSFAPVKQFFFYFFGWFVGIEQVIDPIKKTIHPDAPIEAPAHKKDKKKTSEATSKMCDVPASVAYRNKRQIDDKINNSKHPKRNTTIEHWKNAISRRQHSCRHYNRHNTR